MASGFDAETIEATCRTEGRPCAALNGGLGSTTTIEHLILTRFALSRHKVTTLIYGFFDLQLSDNVVLKNSDLIGNHSMLYYQDPDLALRYANFDTVNRLAFQVYRCCALLRERSAIWAKVERLRREMGAVGMPAEETNMFGRKADFSLLEAPDSKTFDLRCEAALRSSGLLNAEIQAVLQEARHKGTRVIFVEMPMHPTHLRRFYAEPAWQIYRAKARMAVEAAGARYLNASEWVPDGQLFVDVLHLSKQGAIRFSERLANYWLEQSVQRAPSS